MSEHSETDSKYARLLEILTGMKSVLVAFSGGVDSSLVALAAFEALKDKALAVTAVSPTLPGCERKLAWEIAESIGIRHSGLFIDELTSPEFTSNNPNRCYFCKKLRLAELRLLADERHLKFVVDGGNTDDLLDRRPGLKANEEIGVRSPLVEAKINKAEARAILKGLGFAWWNKPSAPCLASRVPYGTPVTREKLAQVEAAEEIVKKLGIAEVRVRHHGESARIEIAPGDFARVIDATELVKQLKEIGFVYVSLDLEGFRSGSLNESLVT